MLVHGRHCCVRDWARDAAVQTEARTMRITLSWTRGVELNKMGGKMWGREEPWELGGGGACSERVVGQVPPSRPSCGHFGALDRDEAVAVGQDSGVGAMCQISSPDHCPSPFTVSRCPNTSGL